MKLRAITGITLTLFLISMLTMVSNIQPVKAEPKTWTDIFEPGYFVDAVGTYFEITNSTYLNITLTSTETVHVILESVPRIVSFIIVSNNSATSTVLTFTDFQPNTTYYRYQDGHLMENFTTDSSGGYMYTQDISQPHHIFIVDEKLTIYINSNYTFTQNINEPIIVNASNIVIDGNGYTLQGPGTFGFYLSHKYNVTIKNTTIKQWGAAIYTSFSSDNTFNKNNISDSSGSGAIYLSYSNDNNITENTIENNGGAGIRLDYSDYNIIRGNIITDSGGGGIHLAHDSSHNTISNNTVVNSLIGVSLVHSPYNTASRNNLTLNIGWGWGSGIQLAYSDETTIIGNNLSLNDIGIHVAYSRDNTVYHNNFINNTKQVQISGTSYYNTWDDGYPSGGNYWSNHVCTGNPSDGSQPYTIDVNNIDHYPFQDPNDWIVHQLTVNSSPSGVTFTINGSSQTTPYTKWLLEASYTLEMPENHDGYIWSHWLEDGDTNRIKTITLPGTTWTGVFSVETATGSGAATFVTDIGTIEDLIAVDEATLPTEGKPNMTFPHGFFSFNVTGLSSGQNVTITITLPSNMTEGTQYWKCQDGTWYQIPIGDDDGDNVITITLTDGGVGDADGIENGVINDPGGLGIPPPPPPPPPAVGGKATPITKAIDKPELQIHWIWLTILLPLAATTIFVKLKKKKR